jgi:hypothetical protein
MNCRLSPASVLLALTVVAASDIAAQQQQRETRLAFVTLASTSSYLSDSIALQAKRVLDTLPSASGLWFHQPGDVTRIITSSGFPGSLSTTRDVSLLSRLLSVDAALGLTTEATATGYRVVPRLYRSADQFLMPRDLAPVEGASLLTVARILAARVAADSAIRITRTP